MAYDNSRRRQAARTTRARILEAATAAFLTRGYHGTTIRQVAEAAGVSQETLYKTFGGKAALLKAVYDVALAGDDEAIPLAARPEALAVRDATSLAEAAQRYAELAQLISGRTDPLLRVLLTSRGTDKALDDFARTIDRERHTGATFFVTAWHRAGWLRADISIEEAIDSVWALNSPQLRWPLLDRGWSEEQYARWLAGLLVHVLAEDASPDSLPTAIAGSR